jgi:hypothetical protein
MQQHNPRHSQEAQGHCTLTLRTTPQQTSVACHLDTVVASYTRNNFTSTQYKCLPASVLLQTGDCGRDAVNEDNPSCLEAVLKQLATPSQRSKCTVEEKRGARERACVRLKICVWSPAATMMFLVLPGRVERTEAADVGLTTDPKAPAEKGRSREVWLLGVSARAYVSAAQHLTSRYSFYVKLTRFPAKTATSSSVKCCSEKLCFYSWTAAHSQQVSSRLLRFGPL